MTVPDPAWSWRLALHAMNLDASGNDTSTGSFAPNITAFGEHDIVHGYNLTKQGAVLTQGTGGSWNEKIVESPSVFWSPEAGKYCIVAVGYDAGPTHATIGVWTADTMEDLISSPTAYGSNPFFSGSGSGADSAGTSGPVVWYEDGTYYLFYIGLTSTGYEAGTKSMCVATSTDWIPGTNSGTWTRTKGIIVPTSGWRSTAIWHANIVKRGSTYYNFFNANGTDEAIGYATSTDLLTWTVDDVNSPVLSKGSGWEGNHIGDPFVYRIGETWYMAYYGADGGNTAEDGLAITSDADFPLGWHKYAGNPILTVGVSGIDTQYAAKPCIFITPTTYYHFYTAIQTGLATGWQVAVATEALTGASLATGTPALTLSTTNSAGAASTVIATDATIAAFDATVPVTQAFGDSAATGSAGFAARRDHVHGMPADPGSGSSTVGHAHVVSETHLSNGSATTYTLDQAFEEGSVIAWNTTTLARLGVTEAQPDQATVSAAGSSGDSIVFDYAATLV